jgi:predicted Zn-dependent protease
VNGDVELGLAQQALAVLDADQAQATVTRERSLCSRFARSAATQATAIDDTSIEMLCVLDGHTGTASTNQLDEAGLADTAQRARAAAAAAARSGQGAYPGLPAPAATQAHDGYDRTTAALDPAAAGAALTEAFAACRDAGLEAFGIWTAGEVTTAIASSTGVSIADAVTDAHMTVIARDRDGRSGHCAATAVAIGAIDPAALAASAAARVSTAEPVSLAPGDYPVILDHAAVGTLLDILGSLAFNGLAHVELRGALCGAIGERVAALCINLADSTGVRGTLPRRFDAEGVPKRPLALIADGIAAAVAHDTRSAALADTTSTGHALAPGGSADGPEPTNLVLAGGDAATLEELCAPIERGLFVTRLWYVNAVEPRHALLTGMTRDGTFLIEDGVISRPLQDVRFTDSVLRILAATEQLTAAQQLVGDADLYGRRFATGVLCPALRAHAFRVSGGSA